MKVYEFLKQAPEDIMALEIGRIMASMMAALGFVNTDKDALECAVKCTSGVMFCLKEEVDQNYYKGKEAKKIGVLAKGFFNKVKEKMDENA